MSRNILTMALLCFCPWIVVFLSMEGQKTLRFHQKYLNLCSKDERSSYGFEMTWGKVINDVIFIFNQWNLGVKYSQKYIEKYKCI